MEKNIYEKIGKGKIGIRGLLCIKLTNKLNSILTVKCACRKVSVAMHCRIDNFLKVDLGRRGVRVIVDVTQNTLGPEMTSQFQLKKSLC